MSENTTPDFPSTHERPGLLIERLSADAITEEDARQCLQLLTRAYTDAFEGETGPLDKDTVKSYFRPEDEESVAKQLERMERSMRERGSQYWIARFSKHDDPESLFTVFEDIPLPGLIKVQPIKPYPWRRARPDSFDITRRLMSSGAYINDIVVDPRVQKMRIGSALVAKALEYGGFAPQKKVELDAYKASTDMNRRFYESPDAMGLKVDHSTIVDPFVFDDRKDKAKLYQVRYVSAPGVTIEGIAKRLRAKASPQTQTEPRRVAITAGS